MIIGVGIDAVELSRIQKIIEEKPGFARRVLTAAEYQCFEGLKVHRRIEYLAGRFCCKEAFSKAWGTGIGKVSLQDIEVLSDEQGAPVITSSPHDGPAFVSITHTETIAMAYIVLEEGK